MSSPSKRIRPALGGSAPATMLKMVVLPAPFGPIIPVMRPASIVKEQRSTAVRPPKRRVRPSTARIGAGERPVSGCVAAVMTRPIVACLLQWTCQEESRK